MGGRTSDLALEEVFHDSYGEGGADAFEPVFLEADIFLGCLIYGPCGHFKNFDGAGAELSVFVHYEGMEMDIADCFDMAILRLLGVLGTSDGLVVAHVILAGG